VSEQSVDQRRDVAGEPAVSVVIPSYNRPDLVLRAVQSALDQTLTDIEVLVIVDGRDEATRVSLAAVGDPRLVVFIPPHHLGNADARNEGVKRARARWIAFLDDDDTWMRGKLAAQLGVAEASPSPRPIVSCRLLVRSEAGEMTWPRRLPRAGEDMSEYFFCRRTPFTGEGIVTTSTILTSRALLLDVPFSSRLGRHVDPDWLLRAGRAPGVSLTFVPEPAPLAIWHTDAGRPRIGSRPNWAESYAWCRTNRALFSRRGYAAFVLHVVGFSAGSGRAWRAFPVLLGEAFRHGRPALIDLLSFFGNFLIPATVQRRAAIWFARTRRAPYAA
jgi:glycosyltransferase involved in cell wall biosynthesis